ncbi:hypothetical protein N0V93_004686 [Gnomoniopsis smithogilvyi]|uniref:BTB domain-containing protein n=1 Tax=Gnomoniopsis smithogilvyi TaxID=1191159 RepID=A0A9W8YRI0_9PEZI|nr:hypothetical protein N0V93_004686 [Gnomoniopsis smithogilvyi]
MYKFYEVDPDADTLLIVPHASKQFAPWQQENSPPASPSADASAAYAGILRGTSRPPNIYASIASNPETRIKVSSKHLSLASKHFRNKFRHLGPAQTQVDGRFHVTLGGYDPAAVIIVMDIIHGRGRKVPKEVSLETLAKVAVFVDAFRCFDAVEVHAERWFEKLGDDLPSGYERDLVLWMYASYIFRQSQTFKKATRIAVLNSDGLIRTLGLQVRAGVIKEIDVQRQQLVRKALEVVHNTVDILQEDKLPCSQGCDTFILGALIKTLHRANLAWPRPSKPFPGVSFAHIVESVNQAQAQVAQFVPGLSLNGSGFTQISRKRKSPNAKPGHALTPDSSPEARATVDPHQCAARKNLAENLGELGVEVQGLALESKLGYYLY